MFIIVKIVYVKYTCNKPLYIAWVLYSKKKTKLNKNQMNTKLHNQNVYIKQKRHI